MKKHLLIIVLAAICSLSTARASASSSNDAYPIAIPLKKFTATAVGGDQIAIGSSRGDVAWAMRTKSRETLSADVWAYSGYHADQNPSREENCGTLVITFAQDKVAAIKLVNESAENQIVASLKANSANKNIASQ